jgi:hypothetical protein
MDVAELLPAKAFLNTVSQNRVASRILHLACFRPLFRKFYLHEDLTLLEFQQLSILESFRKADLTSRKTFLDKNSIKNYLFDSNFPVYFSVKSFI